MESRCVRAPHFERYMSRHPPSPNHDFGRMMEGTRCILVNALPVSAMNYIRNGAFLRELLHLGAALGRSDGHASNKRIFRGAYNKMIAPLGHKASGPDFQLNFLQNDCCHLLRPRRSYRSSSIRYGSCSKMLESLSSIFPGPVSPPFRRLSLELDAIHGIRCGKHGYSLGS